MFERDKEFYVFNLIVRLSKVFGSTVQSPMSSLLHANASSCSPRRRGCPCCFHTERCPCCLRIDLLRAFQISMDPVSLCAAILTMVDTAKGGVRGLRRIKRLWSAPQEIEDLVFEIESLQSTLRDISDFIDVAQSMLYSQTLSQPVSRASSILDSIATLFSSSPFHLTYLTDATRARLVWLQHKNEIKNLFEILRSVRVDLSLKLGLVVAYVCSICSSHHYSQSAKRI